NISTSHSDSARSVICRRFELSESLISGMHTARQPLLICNLKQHRRKCLALFFIEGHQQNILMFSPNLSDPFQCLHARICQVQRVQAPVVRVRPSLDETSLFKAVQERNQSTGMDPEPAGKLLLA